MRREDTARAHVKVVVPLVRDKRVTQILNPCRLLTRSFGAQSVFQSSQSGSVRQPGEWCTETVFAVSGKGEFGVIIVILCGGAAQLGFVTLLDS